MTKFRPCIDLHDGKVKQIVGGSLTDDGTGLVTNFEAEQPASYFADIYRRDRVSGGHVIMLGQGNDAAAREALAAYPGGLQVGGGIRRENAAGWLQAGASHVIVTSWLFSAEGRFLPENLAALEREVGRERLVIDLSCRRDAAGGFRVCMNRWQRWTDLEINPLTLTQLAEHGAEFLVHAADVEGKRAGMDEALIFMLGEHSPIPVTYAGGASCFEDLARVDNLSQGRVDLTIGSALDLFGGAVAYRKCVEWNRRVARTMP